MEKACKQCGEMFTKPPKLSYVQWDATEFCSKRCANAARDVVSDMRPWQSKTVRCSGTTRSGQPCGEFEIEGLEYCLHHIPAELLEEAEEITGMRRCRRCDQYAVDGTDPPACKNHGANAGSVTSREAARRVIQSQVDERFREIMAEDDAAAKVLNPPPLEDPLSFMLHLGAEMEQFRRMMRDRMLGLSEDQWRYRGRDTELVRAEILLYERACDRLMAWAKVVNGMGIENRLAAIEERKIQVMERGLTLALQGSGASLEVQEQARKVLRKSLETASLN